MRIARIQIRNFRNFKHLDVALGRHVVVVGENAVGKSNLLFALRLVLDPTLPDAARQLRLEDFWDGLEISREDRIEVSVDLTDFEDNDDQLALLAEHLIGADPMIARLTYVLQPTTPEGIEPKSEADFEFHLYGGDRPENRISNDVRRRMPFDFWNALRDAEGDLANWRRSPLRPLLDDAASEIDSKTLKKLAEGITKATAKIAETEPVQKVSNALHDKLVELAGTLNSLDMSLGFSPADSERLIRSLRLFIDHGLRGIADASLGTANLVYLALKSLDMDLKIQDGERCHTFLAIEEPEAHLHPHLQRRLFRTFLRPRQPDPKPPHEQTSLHDHGATILLTTHSPYVASVTPASSFVLLRHDANTKSTVGVSSASLDLEQADIADIERYLDVTRGEALFAKGILFVEGEAEEYLVPALSLLLGRDLDELGISVCSVAGTHFLPYISFFGPGGLNIPYAIVTDMDPNEGENESAIGIARATKLLEHLCSERVEAVESDDELVLLANEFGIFLTDGTLEIALFQCGRKETYKKTILDLSTNGAAKKRAKGMGHGPRKNRRRPDDQRHR